MIRTSGIAAVAATFALPVSAQAQTVVPFDGTVVASCILSVSTSGVLAMNTSGTEIGSEQTGGVAAVLGIVATGGAPTVLFTAPIMSIKPVSYVGTPTVSLKYTSTGGANQPYTTAASQYTSTNPLGDTVTLNAKAVDATGFTAGSYRLQTTATCQQ
jgi:hypothetical protein